MSIEDFIARGMSVCPFAARSLRIHVTTGPEPRQDRSALREAAQKFAATEGRTPYGALLVVGPSGNFEQTKRWAREVFCELMTCFGLIDGIAEADVARAVEGQVRPMLFDENERRRPMLGCRNQPLFAICMSPLYPKPHPRYAPETTVVVTWQADVAAVHGQKAAVDRIRAVMERQHGSVYDADELMLPLPKPAV